MGAHEAEPVVLDDAADAGEQMINAAPIGADDARHHAQRFQIEPELADRRTHQGADQDQVATTFTARKAEKPAELSNMNPVMPIARDEGRIGPAMQRKQHDAASLFAQGIGDGERKATAAAHERHRACCGCIARAGGGYRRRRGRAAHGVASSLRCTAMVSGRFPARTNSTILPTSG
jgi:hypothetical protein